MKTANKKMLKGKPVVIKPKVPRAKTKKFAFLHVPSGTYLKLSSNGYSTETKNQIFKYNKIHNLIYNLLFQFSSSLEITRVEPLIHIQKEQKINLYIPGTNTKIKEVIINPINRVDHIDRYAMGSFHESAFLDYFQANPFISFVYSIENGVYDDEFDEDPVYRITINNTKSWDTIMLELFKYMQENQYAMSLRQFSKDKLTRERILLTEFEIVEIM